MSEEKVAPPVLRWWVDDAYEHGQFKTCAMFGPRPPNGRQPQPGSGGPPCPTSVKGEARVAWRRIARRLRQAGVVTPLGRDAMMLLVESWQTWVTATSALRQSGVLIKSPSG